MNKYHPDLLYFDDTKLPLYPFSDAGLKIAQHYYNQRYRNDGQARCGDVRQRAESRRTQRKFYGIWERGQTNHIEPLPWQTDTCIGSWHYDRRIFDQHRYKTSTSVIHTLIDNVSKNGNLQLSIPVKGGWHDRCR